MKIQANSKQIRFRILTSPMSYSPLGVSCSWSTCRLWTQVEKDGIRFYTRANSKQYVCIVQVSTWSISFYYLPKFVTYVQNSSLAVLNLISHSFVTLDWSIVELNSVYSVRLVANKLFTSFTVLFKQLLSFSSGEGKYKLCFGLYCIYIQCIYDSEHSRECFNES